MGDFDLGGLREAAAVEPMLVEASMLSLAAVATASHRRRPMRIS
jgi:hypothetical protein